MVEHGVPPETCLCGRPLHYPDEQAEQHVRREIARVGPTVSFMLPSGILIAVPRHFVVLHAVTPWNVLDFDAVYHFTRVDSDASAARGDPW